MDWDFVGSRILFLIGNGRRVNFGGIDGARIPLCVCHSLLCLLCLLIRKRGWPIFGTPWLRGVGGVGIPIFQEPSMIERWKRQKDSWSGFMGRECIEVWMIWCFGPKQIVESSSSSPYTLL